MKKTFLLASAMVLSLNLFAADANVSPADQKWLGAIEKMVATGHNEITTPVVTRTELLKDWAKKNGYSFQMTQADSTFHIKLSKSIAKS